MHCEQHKNPGGRLFLKTILAASMLSLAVVSCTPRPCPECPPTERLGEPLDSYNIEVDINQFGQCIYEIQGQDYDHQDLFRINPNGTVTFNSTTKELPVRVNVDDAVLPQLDGRRVRALVVEDSLRLSRDGYLPLQITIRNSLSTFRDREIAALADEIAFTRHKVWIFCRDQDENEIPAISQKDADMQYGSLLRKNPGTTKLVSIEIRGTEKLVDRTTEELPFSKLPPPWETGGPTMEVEDP